MPVEISKNVRAFLAMLAWSEGTSTVSGSDRGYNVLVGGKLFHSYSDHPRKKVRLNPTLVSTAAGRYQFLSSTWDELAEKLDLSDFSPESQDLAAVELLRRCKALPLIEVGDVTGAIVRCRKTWASLPAAGYGQREQKLKDLIRVYNEALEALQ